MEKNVCGVDRLARIGLGTVLLLVGLRAAWGRKPGERMIAPRQAIVLYAASDLLITGLLQRCPLNHLLGIDSCGQDR